MKPVLSTLSTTLTPIVFNLSAVVSGVLAGRLRDEAEAAAAANSSLTALLQISRLLQSAVGFPDIEAALRGPTAEAAGVQLLPAEPPRERQGETVGVLRRAQVACLRQLDEFGLLVSRTEAGERVYGETEADIAAACARLARFGIDARHLRTFLTGAGRQSALIEQLVAPGLRSRNAERRKNALEDVEALSRVAQELSHLLLVRDLRATVERTG